MQSTLFRAGADWFFHFSASLGLYQRSQCSPRSVRRRAYRLLEDMKQPRVCLTIQRLIDLLMELTRKNQAIGYFKR